MQMNLDRRNILGAVVGALALSVAGTYAFAQDGWKDMKELNIGVIPSESDGALMERFGVLATYLEQKLGVPVRLRQATDYAGVIEALRSGHIEFARFGPASYSQAWRVTNGTVDPLIKEINADGSFGYHSAIVVNAEGPYRTIDDLKGKVLAFADPNSTSGYLAASFFLADEGKDPNEYFKETIFAGGHEQGILAMLNGTVDAATTGWTAEDVHKCKEMSGKGMIEEGACRFIWKSPILPNSLWAARGDVPVSLKQAFSEAMIELKTDAPDVWQKFTENDPLGGYVEANHADYEPIIRMIEANQRNRRTN